MTSYPLLVLAAILSGCVVPIPIGSIDRAISGSHCVSNTAKVGDVFMDPRTGYFYKLTEINKTDDGTPYSGCGERLPNRAKADEVNRQNSTGWVKLGEGRAGYLYVDSGSISPTTPNGDTKLVLVMLDYKNAKNTDRGPVLSQKTPIEVECKEKRYRQDSASTYSGNMGGGNLVSRLNPHGWRQFKLGSTIERVFNFACQKIE